MSCKHRNIYLFIMKFNQNDTISYIKDLPKMEMPEIYPFDKFLEK